MQTIFLPGRWIWLALAVVGSASAVATESPGASPALAVETRAEELLAPGNLQAWCVVPFDEKGRGPEERARMLEKLGFRHFVYDWRAKDIPSFGAEIEALRQHGIELTGWWSPTDARDPVLRSTLEVFKQHQVHPQLWVMGSGPPTRSPEEQQQRVEAEATRIRAIVEMAAPYGCQVDLYNHGGWFGQPENELAVIERLKQWGITGVGLVYNFSHGHGDLATFPALWPRMAPYVVAVNVTGMVENGESRIIPPSQGKLELGLLRTILASGWRGPIGLIAEQGGDAEVTLGNAQRGLEWCRQELMEAGAGGPRPSFPAAANPAPPSARLGPGRFGQALDATGGGLLLPGEDAWRQAPITVEVWAKLHGAEHFNVLVASDAKSSGNHWELYSYAGMGDFAVFLPGRGEVRSGVKICDDAWHYLAMSLEEKRVRLFADGRLVAERALPARSLPAVPGGLAFGRTVEEGVGCDGLVDEVRISRGAPESLPLPTSPLAQTPETLGRWALDTLPLSAQLYRPEREPLEPAAHPLAALPVNRERLYDFYAKELRDFPSGPNQPALLPVFPGLDGGAAGHWGNQTEADWQSGRWNQMDPGSAQGGVFREGSVTVPRAVCVRLGKLAACFDPDTLSWPEAWSGGFLRFGTARFGFLDGLKPAGEAVPAPANLPAQLGAFSYHGYYRHGTKVIFAYGRAGAEWLESAKGEGEAITLSRERAGEGQLTALTHGGPAQWPQVFTTRGRLGTGQPYALDTLTLPPQTPWHSLWHFSGLDFFPNGDAALCTFEGEVWVVSGLAGDLSQLRWRRFASGLHQPLGLSILEGNICVLGRDQITCLHDLNGDGEADFYECLSRAYETPTGGHDYVTGLRHDTQGRFYLASGKQGVVRVTPGSGEAEILATGFRNPDGIGLGPNGEVAVAVQEGEWTPASMLYEFRPKAGELAGHFGFGGPRPGPRGHLPPLAYLPRGVDHSCGGQVYVEGSRWGAPAGSLVHLSWGNGAAFLVLREQLGGVAQGCVVPLPGDFASGAHRAAFHPQDGQLYVAGMEGWITYAPEEGGFQRLRYTGGPRQAPSATEAHRNGLLLRFAEPLEPGAADDRLRFAAQEWNYRYTSAYGSEEYSVRQPDQRGHDLLAIASAHLLEGGRALFLEIPQLQPANVLHLRCDLSSFVARDLYLTLHQLGSEFTAFPGYQAVAKVALDVHAGQSGADLASTPARPVPWEEGPAGRLLSLQTASGLQFAPKELHARPGERLSLKFENGDAMPHNWVLVKIGAIERIGALATKLISEPDAVARHYVPESPDILAHTRLLEPGKTTTIHFNAPEQPGHYPYLCTFPGHWALMRGELVVE